MFIRTCCQARYEHLAVVMFIVGILSTHWSLSCDAAFYREEININNVPKPGEIDQLTPEDIARLENIGNYMYELWR